MKKKVLIVEDNRQNLYLATFLLEKSGYEVIPALDGIDGVQKAILNKPDLILLDIQLPVMDGYEVARRIKEIDELHHIPLVAITSYAMVGDREKAVTAGCTGHIEKPIVPEFFVSEVEKYLP